MYRHQWQQYWESEPSYSIPALIIISICRAISIARQTVILSLFWTFNQSVFFNASLWFGLNQRCLFFLDSKPKAVRGFVKIIDSGKSRSLETNSRDLISDVFPQSPQRSPNHHFFFAPLTYIAPFVTSSFTYMHLRVDRLRDLCQGAISIARHILNDITGWASSACKKPRENAKWGKPVEN
jgi:hypothetical protein